MGFKVVLGDRFSHLIGGEAGKGVAVHRLVELYRASHNPDAPVVTIGLGNSPNDLDMLENVDHAIVLPGESVPILAWPTGAGLWPPPPPRRGGPWRWRRFLNQLQMPF